MKPARSALELEQQTLNVLDDMLAKNRPVYEAELLVAALQDGFPEISQKLEQRRVRRALKGYRKQMPPKSRAPIAKEIAAAIINLLLAWQLREQAIMVAVMLVTYCRPGEIRSLRVRQLLRPKRTEGPLSLWGLVISPDLIPAENGGRVAVRSLSKTGTMDDTVLFDNHVWLGILLGAMVAGRQPDDHVFNVKNDEQVRAFRAASVALGLPADTCLYQLRHGGASEDLISGARSKGEVMRRGRWRTEGSVLRYGKPAMLHRLLGVMSPALVSHGELAWQHLQGLLEGTQPASVPAGLPTSLREAARTLPLRRAAQGSS